MEPMSRPPRATLPSRKPTSSGASDRQQSRNQHLFEGELGDDVDACTVIRFGGTFHDARNFTELTADFVDHRAAGVADGLHGDGGEQVGQQAADEQADDDVDVGQVEGHGFLAAALHLEFHDVGGKQHQRGQTGGADGIALGDGLGGVADRIQGIGDGADASSISAISAIPPALSVMGP
jgi:hypothetical protein